jgi:hypothetical protein
MRSAATSIVSESTGTKARYFFSEPKFAISRSTGTRPCNVQNSVASWLEWMPTYSVAAVASVVAPSAHTATP